VIVSAGERTTPAQAAPDDPERFGEWVRPHLRPVAHLVARLAPAADRDDVVQEVLVRAWVKRRLYDPARGTAAAWLLAIAADQAAKARRRARRQPVTDSTAEPVAHTDLAAPGNVDLSRALGRLSRRQRLAVECVYFVGLSVAETAAVMRCAEGTVKSTLADARGKLRTLLEVTG
jgi:RNA polymerase sigma-70 factor (ECF subfamily)